jgi:hypothetical protein
MRMMRQEVHRIKNIDPISAPANAGSASILEFLILSHLLREAAAPSWFGLRQFPSQVDRLT